MVSTLILLQEVRHEQDVATIRQRARDIAARLGFGPQDQVRIATAVSELARLILAFAGQGKAEFRVEERAGQQAFTLWFTDMAQDRLAKLADPSRLPEERFRQRATHVCQLMDYYATTILPDGRPALVVAKTLPARLPAPSLAQMANALPLEALDDPFEEIYRQNQELADLLQELRERQEQLTRINQELEDRNRGITSLYAVLEEQTEALKRANRLKSRFMSQMSHEFRTPLSSIIALARLLLDRLDGDLTVEQERQVALIQGAAQELLDMIDDLLDLAKIEAGKITVQPSHFTLAHLFSSLRGMFKPLHTRAAVQIIFEEPPSFPEFYTDERKVAQILRNFISNALKFTEQGEVRVTAHVADEGHSAVLSVRDTGIGISAEDQAQLFQDFSQAQTHLHKIHKGAGLGLALSRQLAEVLGGKITMESTPDQGSTFAVSLPFVYPESSANMAEVLSLPPVEASASVLIIEDNPDDLNLYKDYLRDSHFRVVSAETLTGAWEILKHIRPVVIILDILLAEESGWDFLVQLRRDERLGDIPVIVSTVVSGEQQTGFVLGADEYAIKPVSQEWLLERLETLSNGPTLLIIDDDATWRYTFRKTLEGSPYRILEATHGSEGLRLAAEKKPGLIFLDLVMPGMSGFEVLERLKADPELRPIPVIVYSSMKLQNEERRRLKQQTVEVLAKETSSRDMILSRIRDVLIQSGGVR